MKYCKQGTGETRALLNMAVYCATKAALTHWTNCLARETQAQGVVVFANAPGFVRTPATEYLTGSADVPNETGDYFRAFLNERRDTPMARSAQLLLFLVSGRADALSGRFIDAKDEEEALVRRCERNTTGQLACPGRANVGEGESVRSSVKAKLGAV